MLANLPFKTARVQPSPFPTSSILRQPTNKQSISTRHHPAASTVYLCVLPQWTKSSLEMHSGGSCADAASPAISAVRKISAVLQSFLKIACNVPPHIRETINQFLIAARLPTPTQTHPLWSDLPQAPQQPMQTAYAVRRAHLSPPIRKVHTAVLVVRLMSQTRSSIDVNIAIFSLAASTIRKGMSPIYIDRYVVTEKTFQYSYICTLNFFLTCCQLRYAPLSGKAVCL